MGEVHQAGQEAPVGLRVHRQQQPPVVGQAQHADGRLVQGLLARPEQLLTRAARQHVEQLLAAPGLDRHLGPMDRSAHPPLDDRDVQDVFVQGGGREQPEEPVPPDGAAAVVDDPDHDVVGVLGAQHPARSVGAGDHDQRPLADHVREAVGSPVVAQHPQPRPGHGPQRRVDGLVAAIAEEVEVTVGEPAQQPCRVVALGRGARPGELGGQRGHRAGESGGVGGDVVHRREHLVELGSEVLALVGCRRVELEPHPRLDEGAGRWVGRVGGGVDVAQSPVGVTAHHHHRVHDVVHLPADPTDPGEHRRHQRSGLVGDQVDDGRDARSVVGVPVDVDDRASRGAAAGQPEVRASGGVERAGGIVEADDGSRGVAGVEPAQFLGQRARRRIRGSVLGRRVLGCSAHQPPPPATTGPLTLAGIGAAGEGRGQAPANAASPGEPAGRPTRAEPSLWQDRATAVGSGGTSGALRGGRRQLHRGSR